MLDNKKKKNTEKRIRETRVMLVQHSPRALRSRSNRAVLGKDLLLDSPVTEKNHGRANSSC